MPKAYGKVELTLFAGVEHTEHPMKYTPVMTLRVKTAGAPKIPERARRQICVRKARKCRQVLLYELVETAQAILISYILIDGSAQAVSHIVGFISAWLKSLR